MGPKRNYENVFVPLEDIYEISGPDVFGRLGSLNQNGKNLIVVPSRIWRKLGHLAREGSTGAEHTLKFLRKIKDTRTVERSKGVGICSVNPSLDVAILDEGLISEKGSVNHGDYASLENIIRERWEATEGRDSGRPEFITTDDNQHLEWGMLHGLKVEGPKFVQVSSDVVNEGIIMGSDDLCTALYGSDDQSILLEHANDIMERELFPHQFLKFRGTGGDAWARVTGKMRYSGDGSRVLGMDDPKVVLLSQSELSKRNLAIGDHVRKEIFGIKPRDTEQYLAMQYGLLNPDVKTLFLCGKQGSGKTLLAYVCAVDLAMWYGKDLRNSRLNSGFGRFHKRDINGGLFKRIILLKPNDILGGARREIGFLPGSEYDKLRPHLAPYSDAHEESTLGDYLPFEEMLKHPMYGNNIFSKPRGSQFAKKNIDGGILSPKNEVFRAPHSGFMRGRSIPGSIFLLDEAQNYTPYEVKTILERLAPFGRVVVMGDPAQTDNPLCSREINGLTHSAKSFLPASFAAMINLSRNYRSEVSDWAGDMKVYGR
jgi:hypothetical protein